MWKLKFCARDWWRTCHDVPHVQRLAEEGKAEEQMLAELKEKVLNLKETLTSVLAAQSHDLEKLANMVVILT